MRLSVGTSGFSYAQWRGPFYPADLPASDMLAWYATRLPAVEINNTFYRLPRRSVLEAWAAQVPETFRFAVKVSRRITHLKRLKDAGDETRYLLDTTRALGARLGALLFQLPPNLKRDLEERGIDPDQVWVRFQDDAPGFDPRQGLRPPALDQPLAERRIGGLGVYLAFTAVDGFAYDLVAGRNVSPAPGVQ